MKCYFQKFILVFILFSVFVLQSQNSHLQHFTVDDGLPRQEVIDIVQDDFGFLWIASKTGEITRFDGDNFEVFTYKKALPKTVSKTKSVIKYNDLPKNIQSVIPQSIVNKFFLDKQNNKWIATSRGLYRLSKSNFKHYLKGNYIKAIDNYENSLLVATTNKLLEIDSVKTTQIADNQNISSVASNNGNQLFIGVKNQVLVLDSLKVVDTITFNSNIHKILIQKEKVWVATVTNGISSFSYDYSTKSIFNKVHFDKDDGVYDVDIVDLQVDRIGRLWYVSQQGFIGVIDKNIVKHIGKVIPYNAAINKLIFNKTKVFIATEGRGIWRSEVKENLRFKKLNLASKNINQILFDADNYLWIGTQKGVDKVLLDKNSEIKELVHFGKNDGFKGIETTKNTISEDTFGNIWFGTVNGLMKYEHPKNNKTYTRPNIYFETIEVVYNAVDTINLDSWTNSDKTLYLKPTDNHLSFSFRTVDLRYSSDIQYRFKLNGEDWSPWSKDRKVNFSSLNAGNYNFQVQSQILNKQKSEPISFKFLIGLPLVKKLWFQLLIIGVLLLIGFLILKNYLQKIKKRNLQVQEKLKIENNLLSLEQKALQLQMNPHFIFNILNGIKALGTSDAKKMNTTINKFATLLRQTLSNSRKENITLKEEINTLKNYIEVEQLMNEKKFNYSINISNTIDIEEVLIPPMLVQPFVENAIAHGIKSVDRVGELTISFTVKNEFLQCTVQDNGIGIEESKRRRINVNHQSMALKVTKERIESLSGKDTFMIEQLNDKNNKILGTKVSFKIPLLTDY